MAASFSTSSYQIADYSRHHFSDSASDISIFINEFKDRINKAVHQEEDQSTRTPFISFAEKILSFVDLGWLDDNAQRFIKETPNEDLVTQYYLAECGDILCMIYSADGESIIVGYSTGLIQVSKMSDSQSVLAEYEETLYDYYNKESTSKIWYPMFYRAALKQQINFDWVTENQEAFLNNTSNEILSNRWFFSESGAITAMQYSPSGNHMVVGHSTGLIEMRNGITGAVLCTLRNIQFPPKPVYSLQYSLTEENVCYAACMDGAVYRIEIPHIETPVTDAPSSYIRADPQLECLNTQFYGSPGISSYSTPFITQRSPALCLGLLADQNKMVVGYGDTAVKIYDMETQEVDVTYKVHKLRLQFIPKKLQRMHFGQVVALKAHPTKPFIFASGAWDKTLRIWDVRCKVGCVMTFEGVDICSDSIDLCREQCIAGSWSVTEALTVWDLTARKKLNVIRVQNRRPDVDGEYIYACRYWHSTDYNRKGKYGIIGGSGTKCVEVINLHNRYITCSYPAAGTVLAITSHQDRIAFGGTYPAFCIVSFHDPKHEKELYEPKVEPDYDYTKASLSYLEDDASSVANTYLDNLSPASTISRIPASTISRIA